MATRIYGASDDLIEFEGEFHGEVGCFGTDDSERGVLVIVNDGTLLEVKYGKNGDAIWEVRVLVKGTAFTSIVPCDDPDAKIYSDIVELGAGIKWAYAATKWQKVD